MKGIELPINILVIVSIAVIVLLGLAALFFVGYEPPEELIFRRPCEDLQISLMNGYDGKVGCVPISPPIGDPQICECYFYKIIEVGNSTYGQLDKTEIYDIMQ